MKSPAVFSISFDNSEGYNVLQWSGRMEEKGNMNKKRGGGKLIIKEQEKEYLRVLTEVIYLTSFDARGKAFYLNTSKR